VETIMNDAHAARRKNSASAGASLPTAPSDGPGVLVADDEGLVRTLLRDALHAHGYRVWLAADGEEAVELFRQNQEAIGLALLDVRMPRRNGPETLTALRAIKPELRACFVSGHTGEYSDEDLVTVGASAILHKPFRVSELVRLLKELTAAC
jgi:two-component system cell cycle sensor histidine kinase/response regulator CckA